jgi:MFS family permease
MTSPAWYHGLSRQQWLVLTLACLGWLFDTMDQRLFIIVRQHAMRELLPADTSPEQLTAAGSTATAWFIAGWATDGLLFGPLGDTIGRARTMILTVLLYSLFTGLSAVSVGFWDFCLYRFLAGLGVGGEFAAGVDLVAEVMPERSRTHALGLLQVMAIVGTLLGTLLSVAVPPGQSLAG